jgi:Tol biopolymer transport system component
MSRHSAVFRGTFLAVLLVVLNDATTLARRAPEVRNGDLLYFVRTTVDCTDSTIAVVDPRGKRTRNLTLGTNIRAAAFQATWSPDGQKIAFTGSPCSTPPQGHLYVMNADGSGITEIPTAPARDVEYPTWSPDGTRLAFVGVDSIGHRSIFSIDVDGTDLQTLLASVPGFSETFHSLKWSPDGRTLLFSGTILFPCPRGCGFGTEVEELYLLSLESGDVVQLTDNDVGDADASWSPDGRHIVFSREGTLLVMDLETAETRPLIKRERNQHFDRMPVWSPDGEFVAYISARPLAPHDPHFFQGVFIVNADGNGHPKRLTDGPVHEAPDWQPVLVR